MAKAATIPTDQPLVAASSFVGSVNGVEYWFRESPPHNGGEANAAVDSELDRYMHLWALNRGILMTPFHNMALIAADTTEADVDYHTQVFREAVKALFG